MQVRAAIKVRASIIICFTSSGRAARFHFVSFYNFPLLKGHLISEIVDFSFSDFGLSYLQLYV